jgi:hypothetical protein
MLAAFKKVLRESKKNGGAIPGYAKDKSLNELAAKGGRAVK